MLLVIVRLPLFFFSKLKSSKKLEMSFIWGKLHPGDEKKCNFSLPNAKKWSHPGDGHPGGEPSREPNGPLERERDDDVM